ncbi:hypothetical protein PHET_03143 [Paragonimus heterotremus]|uniref:Uncharacterized protein n=1 Tax=Paragonimus heterotremus TaxID=100268 RepID=A0A8J4TF00_9TREM|nr:hypothetical protein PHET_03143 [Paragonimus heterotremus]
MLPFLFHLASLLLITSFFDDSAPLMAIPLDMWAPGVFPSEVPRLSPKLAKVAAQLDKRGKPPVMQDLTQFPGTLDMDNEFRVPLLANFAVRTDEFDGNNAKVEENSSHKTVDRILIDRPMHRPDASLLYGGYGHSGVVAIPVVQGVYQARAYVPVVVPVVQQPVVQVPRTVAVVQPQLIQTSQQTSMLATQQVLTQQSDSVGRVPQSVGSQQLVQPQQSRMTIPQTVAQPQPVVQPQPVPQPQPDVQPQPVIQSQPAVLSQGRMALPTGSNTVSANGIQPSGGQSQVRQGTVQSQSSITIRHQVVPHHIHITIPKSKQRMKPGYYVYSGSY